MIDGYLVLDRHGGTGFILHLKRILGLRLHWFEACRDGFFFAAEVMSIIKGCFQRINAHRKAVKTSGSCQTLLLR